MYCLVDEMLGVVATLFIKVSVCLLVRRIIRGTHPKLRVLLWTMIGFLFAVAFTTCVLYGTHCQPFRKSWDPDQPGVCLPPTALAPLMRAMGGK